MGSPLIHKLEMRLVFYLVVVILLSSCSVLRNKDAQSIEGKYVYTDKTGLGISLEINSGNRFKYSWWAGMNGGGSTGRWEVINGSLLLNSDRQRSETVNESYVVLRNEISKENSGIVLTAYDSKMEPIPFHTCKFIFSGGSIFLVSDKNGKCHYSGDEPVIGVELSYTGYRHAELKFNTAVQSRSVDMLLWQVHENYEFMTNERWGMKGKALTYVNEKGDRFLFKKSD